MRRFTALFVSVALSAALVGAFAGTASAAVAEKKSVKKFCKKATDADAARTSVASGADENAVQDAAGDLETDFKKLAKLAPTKKLKKAVKTMASYYGNIADGQSITEISPEDAQGYATAVQTFSAYLLDKCVSSTSS
jgi:hypothetical protein